MDSFRPADPWEFAAEFVAPASNQFLRYGTLYEFGQGSPLWGACFWVRADGHPIKLYDTCGGPPVWDVTGNKAALPVWEQHWLSGTMAKIAVLDTQAATLTILARQFHVLHLQHFQEQLITGIDSPAYHPRHFQLEIATEIVEAVRQLAGRNSC
jgi:hypothetical protein